MICFLFGSKEELNQDDKISSFWEFFIVLDASLVAHRLMEELNLDFIAMMWRNEVGCSLRSRELNLFQIENFQGHEHAGVAHWADVQRFIDKLE